MRIFSVLLLSTILPLLASAQEGAPQVQAEPAWNPYLAGALIGVLTWFTFYFSQKPIGASSAYAKVAGLIGNAVSPRHTQSTKYFSEQKPRVDWELVFVGSIIVGSFTAAWTGGELTGRWLPPFWVEEFGNSVWLRLGVAFLGGFFIAIGARMAGGCTSGHGISGTLQLALGSWISLICFFIGGVITASLLYYL